MSTTTIADLWVQTDWATFVELTTDPAYRHAKFYYRHNWMRLEMAPVGCAHARDNGLVTQIVGLYAFGRDLRFKSLVNVSLRRTDQQEAQPDLAYYLGEGVTLPVRSNSPIDLDRYAPPDLTIEIAATSLEDDLTVKRELYAELGVREYWVVDTDAVRVWMFAGDVGGGVLKLVDASRVLPGLSSIVLAEALHLGQSEDDAAAMRYILDLKK